MAYYDFDGKITIDENAAFNDIRLMGQAKDILENARSNMQRVSACAEGCKGQTAQAILEKSQEMYRKTTALIDQLEAAQNFIRCTVDKYYRIDQQVKADIQAMEK